MGAARGCKGRQGARHGDEVDGGVGRAACDHHEAHGVLEGLHGHDEGKPTTTTTITTTTTTTNPLTGPYLHGHDVARLDVELYARLQRGDGPTHLGHLG
eukprot:scaffold73145_cov36-Phaeocystis_antarctica.AAC.2